LDYISKFTLSNLENAIVSLVENIIEGQKKLLELNSDVPSSHTLAEQLLIQLICSIWPEIFFGIHSSCPAALVFSAFKDSITSAPVVENSILWVCWLQSCSQTRLNPNGIQYLFKYISPTAHMNIHGNILYYLESIIDG
jgi:hypothetical protein